MRRERCNKQMKNNKYMMLHDDVQNQHGCPTFNLSYGRPERTRMIKQQGNTGGVPVKVPSMSLSMICKERSTDW